MMNNAKEEYIQMVITSNASTVLEFPETVFIWQINKTDFCKNICFFWK
jgi:hypothetical protein